MTRQERQGWIIVAALFVTLFLVWGGGVNTGAVFFPPLLHYFGWSRARLSTLGAAGALMAGVCGPLVGWLLDRIGARALMVSGAAVAGVAFIAASRADSYAPLLGANLAIAVGVTATTLLPCSFLVATWFGARRGLAMGITFAGTSLGGAGMTVVAMRAVASGGWRTGYVAMGVPMLVIVIPLVLVFVRAHTADAADAIGAPGGGGGAEAAPALPGVELRDALHTRSFWMIAAAQFFYACAVSGVGLHLIAYLIGAGYTAASAAGALSMIFIAATVGKLTMGPFADRVSARTVLALVFGGATAGTILLLGAGRATMLAGFIVLNGAAAGVPLVLLPMVMVESLGLRRLGSVMGLTGVFGTIGAAIGPVAAGRIFDVTGSYVSAFSVFAAMWLGASLAIFACLPLAREQARLARAAALAPAAP
jgi:MFS family permease